MVEDLLTLADLRRETSLPSHVINHALDRFGPAPAARIGIARVWARSQLSEILQSIQKTAARSTVARRARTQEAGT